VRRLVPLLAMFVLGCGGGTPCASSLACGTSAVCGHAGVCTPLASPASARFARSRWIAASDWATSSSERAPRADALPVGGGAESLLAFRDMPPQGRILTALLVLTPHDAFSRVLEDAEIVVERVEPFRGGALRPRAGEGTRTFAAAIRSLPAGPARPLHIDLTSAARDAAGRRDRTLYLLVRQEGGARATYRSPWSPSAGTPRLEVLVQ
jgi:hypothetical protein